MHIVQVELQAIIKCLTYLIAGLQYFPINDLNIITLIVKIGLSNRILLQPVPVKEHGVREGICSESHRTKIQSQPQVKEREEEAFYIAVQLN